MINFRSARFIKSAPNYLEAPELVLPEIIVIGKSNVGKSSLLNALCENKNLAYTSSKPGYTKLLNYFDVEGKFYLVDAPGYGYTITGSKHLDLFSNMMEDYFKSVQRLKGVIYLLDSRHEPSQDDKDFHDFLVKQDIPFVLVVTKVDKLNQSEKSQITKNLAVAFGDLSHTTVILTSSLEPRTLLPLKKAIDKLLG